MTDGLTPGQHVNVYTDDGVIAGTFVRPGEQAEGITVESLAVNGPYKRDVAWVQRSDTGDVESFRYQHVSAAE